MNAPKRMSLCALMLLMAIYFVPLWGRTASRPCAFLWWRFTLLYGPPQLQTALPNNILPAFPPRCLEALHLNVHRA